MARESESQKEFGFLKVPFKLKRDICWEFFNSPLARVLYYNLNGNMSDNISLIIKLLFILFVCLFLMFFLDLENMCWEYLVQILQF